MSEPEVDYEVVSSASQLGDLPKLRRELVVLPEWPTKRGKASAFWQYELSTGEHGEFDISDQVYDEAGNILRVLRGGRIIRFLARTTRDGDGNRVWPTTDAAEQALDQAGKSITNKLLQAANRVNYEDAPSAAAALKSAEGNSEETSTSS